MSLADDVDLDEFVMTKDDLSGADIKVLSLPSSL
jgi:ATP-dependent 26S proteasome regulatory subunit